MKGCYYKMKNNKVKKNLVIPSYPDEEPDFKVLQTIFDNILEKKPVMQLLVNYNWGPPISGRYDGGDFLYIFFATNVKGRSANSHLYGRETGSTEWKIIEGIKERYTPNLGNNGYALVEFDCSCISASSYPEEYVIRVDDGNGNIYYDNNNQENYHLHPYLGRDHISPIIIENQKIYRLNHSTNYHLVTESRF